MCPERLEGGAPLEREPRLVVGKMGKMTYAMYGWFQESSALSCEERVSFEDPVILLVGKYEFHRSAVVGCESFLWSVQEGWQRGGRG